MTVVALSTFEDVVEDDEEDDEDDSEDVELDSLEEEELDLDNVVVETELSAEVLDEVALELLDPEAEEELDDIASSNSYMEYASEVPPHISEE